MNVLVLEHGPQGSGWQRWPHTTLQRADVGNGAKTRAWQGRRGGTLCFWRSPGSLVSSGLGGVTWRGSPLGDPAVLMGNPPGPRLATSPRDPGKQSAPCVLSWQQGVPGGESVCPCSEGHTTEPATSPPQSFRAAGHPPRPHRGHAALCFRTTLPRGSGTRFQPCPHPSLCLTRHHPSLSFFACGGGGGSHLRRQPRGLRVKAVVRRLTWPLGPHLPLREETTDLGLRRP